MWCRGLERCCASLLCLFVVAGVAFASEPPPRGLLDADTAGAVKVSGVPEPHGSLSGLYYPTQEVINDAVAYIKDDASGPDSPSNLWLARDPTGYWCFQPRDKKGTPDAIMISSLQNMDPESAGGWQLWHDGGWEVRDEIDVERCEDHACDRDEVIEISDVIDTQASPAPAPLPRAFDNSPGVSMLTPNHVIEEPTTMTSWRLWAFTALGCILIIAFTECLLNSENSVARSYASNVQSSTLTFIISILSASQVVALITLGYWRTSWLIELILFIIGFIMLHHQARKNSFSPVQRALLWAFWGSFVGFLGVAAFLDLREALFGWNCWFVCYDGVLSALFLGILFALLLALLHSIVKRMSKGATSKPGEIAMHKPFLQGQKLHSANGRYRLELLSDGDLRAVECTGPDDLQVIWSTGSAGKGSQPYKAVLQGNSNFAIYGGVEQIWETNTVAVPTKPAATLARMDDDGDLKLFDAGGGQVWSSEKLRPKDGKNRGCMPWDPTLGNHGKYHDWTVDEQEAERNATIIVAAFVAYNLLRALANVFGSGGVVWLWAIFVIIIIVMLCSLSRHIKRLRESEEKLLTEEKQSTRTKYLERSCWGPAAAAPPGGAPSIRPGTRLQCTDPAGARVYSSAWTSALTGSTIKHNQIVFATSQPKDHGGAWGPFVWVDDGYVKVSDFAVVTDIPGSKWDVLARKWDDLTLIAATLSLVLGISAVSGMQKVHLGLRHFLQELGHSAVFAMSMEILLVTIAVITLIHCLSRHFKAKPLTLGPFGGPGGDAFKEVPSQRSGRRLVALKLAYGNEVNYVQPIFANGSMAAGSGEDTGSKATVEFEADGRGGVVGIKVWSKTYVDALQFIFADGTMSEKYGGNGGTLQTVYIPAGKDLIGIGGAASARIDKIEFYAGDKDESYGCLDVSRGTQEGGPLGHCPEEVWGFAIALAIVWSHLFSGLLGDLVPGLWCVAWAPIPGRPLNNFVWFHALLCIFMAYLLWHFWRRVVFPRMVMHVKDVQALIDGEKKTYNNVNTLRDGYME